MHFVCCVLLWLPLIGATLNGNRPRQYDDPDGWVIDCKEVSLTEPTWYIYDPQYSLYNFEAGGTLGEAAFGVYNTATNESFGCLVTDIDLTLTGDEISWYNCSIPNAQFTFDKTANVIGLRETWACDNAPTQVFPTTLDPPRRHRHGRLQGRHSNRTGTCTNDSWLARLEFVGSGTTEIPIALGCAADEDYSCIFGNTLIKAELFSPLDITPFEPWMPRIPYQYPEFCVQRSYYPTWEVDDLLYDHAAKEQSLSFSLTNMANGNKVSCAIDVDEALTRGSSHEARWVDCNSDSPSKEMPEGGVSGTKILFDRDYSLLGVQQTWRCRDNDTSETNIVSP